MTSNIKYLQEPLIDYVIKDSKSLEGYGRYAAHDLASGVILQCDNFRVIMESARLQASEPLCYDELPLPVYICRIDGTVLAEIPHGGRQLTVYRMKGDNQ